MGSGAIVKKMLAICTLLAVFLAGAGMAAAQPPTIRVALVSGQYTAEISCVETFQVISGDTVQELPAGRYFLNVRDDALTLDKFTFGRSITIAPGSGQSLPLVNKRAYRGSLQAFVQDGRLLVNNIVTLDEYLCGVLPSKTMPVWPDEAIKAQAIAARSYAWRLKGRSYGAAYDISANDSELPYTGLEGEKQAISALVMATAGQILRDARGEAVQGVSTSSSGGRTESALALWGREVSYLQSVEDYDQDSPDYDWEQAVVPVWLQNLLEQNGYSVGKLESVRLTPLEKPGEDRTASGRVRQIVFNGTEGSCKIDGAALMQMLSLKSTLFDIKIGQPLPETLKIPIENKFGMEVGSKEIDIKVKSENKPVWKDIVRNYHLLSGAKDEKIIFQGHGSGTGLGLSMWGARGMVNADENITCARILRHYYPGTVLSSI